MADPTATPEPFRATPDQIALLQRALSELTEVAGPTDEAELAELEPGSGFDLLAWAWRSRMSLFPPGEHDLLVFGDLEIFCYLSRHDDLFVVDQTSRGGPRRRQGTFSAAGDAVRFLLLELGPDDGRDRPWIFRAGPPAAGVSLEDGPGIVRVSWSGRWAEFPKRLGAHHDGVAFSHVVTRSMSQVAALYG